LNLRVGECVGVGETGGGVAVFGRVVGDGAEGVVVLGFCFWEMKSVGVLVER